VETAQEAQDIHTLRRLAREVRSILTSVPLATRVRNDWGEESFTTRLNIDPDRANLAGISNHDVANSSTAAINGIPLATLLEGDKQIPVVAHLRLAERARLSDLNNQIGGLIFATFATLLLVPVIYSIFLLDLKIVCWGGDVSSGKTPRPR